MIPYHFDYYRPDTIAEAVQAHQDLDKLGKNPYYYNGGSEIISMARVNNLSTGAVIDLKAIPECGFLGFQDDDLVIGSSVTLTMLTESKVFPLLAKSCGRIADHTMQCKITIGGNICGTILYKEALLPILLADGIVITADEKGKRKERSIHEVFDQELKLSRSEFIVQFHIKRKYLELPYYHIKKTKNEKIDYPLISLAALYEEETMRIAFSGLCSFPFRSKKIESELNNKKVPIEDRIKNVLQLIPAPVLNDLSGSSGYRLFVLNQTLANIEKDMEGQVHVQS